MESKGGIKNAKALKLIESFIANVQFLFWYLRDLIFILCGTCT